MKNKYAQGGGILAEAAISIALLIIAVLGIFDINQVFTERSVLNRTLEHTGDALIMKNGIPDCESDINTLHSNSVEYIKFYLKNFYNITNIDSDYNIQSQVYADTAKKIYLLLKIKKNAGLGIFGLSGIFPVCSTLFVPVNISIVEPGQCSGEASYSWEDANSQPFTLERGKNDQASFC